MFVAELDAIANSPEPPTFANTIVPLEDIGRHLDRAETIMNVFGNHLSTPAVQAVEQGWAPKRVALDAKVTFNDKLFRRVSTVHAGRDKLDREQQRLVTLHYDMFVKNGARLSGEARTRVGKTNAVIARIAALRGERAKLLGFASHAHWSLSDTMVRDPQKAKDALMRVWPAAVARVRTEVTDMEAVAKRDGLKLPLEPWDYAYYAEKVRKARFDQVRVPAIASGGPAPTGYQCAPGKVKVGVGCECPPGFESARDRSGTENTAICAAIRVRNLPAVRPYLELNRMVAASFWVAERLYGLTFAEITGKSPGWHPDVRVWEVKDRGGAYVGLFYADHFARAGKRRGAWAMTLRYPDRRDGSTGTPVVSTSANFPKGGPGDPALLTIEEAETLFHEFGHALHTLLLDVRYPSFAATPTDFVEFPSQLLEDLVLTRPVLDKFGKHYQTGQAMPQALVESVRRANAFNQGFETVQYLSSAMVDLELHSLANSDRDARAVERDTLKAIGMPSQVGMRHRLPHFLHLFASDAYSAKYYSYLWSEIMAADGRAAFTETKDELDPGVAGKLRMFIIAPGNSTDRSDAYRQFRGRDPDVNALLRKRGFAK